MNEWINEVWWTHTGIVFNHKKEGILDICENTDEPWEYYYPKWNKSTEKDTYDFSYMYMWHLKKNPTKPSSQILKKQMVAARGRRWAVVGDLSKLKKKIE